MFTDLELKPPVASGASKIAAVYDKEGKRLEWTLPSLRVVWEPSCVDTNQTGRLTLALEPDQETMDFYDLLDTSFIKLATENSVALFGKALTSEQVALLYTSPLRRSARGSHVRVKLVPPGTKYPTRMWTEAKEPAAWPSGLWVGNEAKVHVVLSSLWVAAGRWGLTTSGTDIILHPISEEDSEPVCPF
jgi:hypothetical protein